MHLSTERIDMKMKMKMKVKLKNREDMLSPSNAATGTAADTTRRSARASHTARRHRAVAYFFDALAADLVTLAPLPGSFFVTDLMMPTATVWRMSRTAKRPSGG